MLRFGVLGVARIATQKVIPAMLRSELVTVRAIASRDPQKAREAAAQLGVPTSHGSYAELLADPTIDAIYNPLPNHLHVPLSLEAAAAGKHVLCEKPIALTAADARRLIEARDRHGVVIAEAFMVKTHPQWTRAKAIVESGEIGHLRQIIGAFSYFNRDAANIRNVEEYGGGALMDIGCYPVFLSRWLFGREPKQAMALIDRDPDFKTDRLTSGILDFGDGQAIFSAGTQTSPHQTMLLVGTKGRITVEIPFNAPPDRPTRIQVDLGGALDRSGVRVEEFAAVDQYTLQGEAFALAVRNGEPPPVTLEESVANLQTIEALLRSVSWGRWEPPGDVPCETCL